MQSNENFVSNLKLLAFSALYAWKKILVIALILAVLLGGLQAFKTPEKTQEQEAPPAAELTQAQKNNLADYEYWLDVAQKNVERQTNYLNNSIYMKLDYYNVWTATKVYFVDTNYQILPGNVYQEPDHTSSLIALYLQYIQAADTMETIATEIGTTARYAKELFMVNNSGSTFTVTALYQDQETASRIMALIDAQIQAAYTELTASVCTHELSTLINTCTAQVDLNVYSNQQASTQKLMDYQASLTKLESEYEALTAEVTVSAPTPAPVANTETSFAKMAIIGFVIGFLLMTAVVLLGTIFSNKITTQKKLANNFSFAVLGSLVQEDKKYDFITRLIRKLDGKQSKNTDSNFQYVAQNLLNHIGDSKNVLVCCDTGEATAQFVVEKLKQYTGDVTLMAAGSMSSDAQALKLLKSTDKLILAVTIGATCGNQISVASTLAQQAEKPIAGMVIID